MFEPFERFLSGTQPSFELARLHRFKDLAKLWARLKTEGDQVVPSYEWRRNNRFVSEFLAFPNKKFVVVEHAMAAFAIDPMQLKLVVKGWPRHETLQFGHPHLGRVLENHVLPYHFDCRLDFSAGKSQAPHDLFSHFRTKPVMPTKANSSGLIYGRGARFSHVVKQHGKNERHRNLFRQKI